MIDTPFDQQEILDKLLHRASIRRAIGRKADGQEDRIAITCELAAAEIISLRAQLSKFRAVGYANAQEVQALVTSCDNYRSLGVDTLHCWPEQDYYAHLTTLYACIPAQPRAVPLMINLSEYSDRPLIGYRFGTAIREQLCLDHADQINTALVLLIPKDIHVMGNCFFAGLLAPTVVSSLSEQAFYQRVTFSMSAHMEKIIRAHVSLALLV
jgi:hypothetical protein